MPPAREIDPTSEPATLKTTPGSLRHLVDPASASPSEHGQYLRIFKSTVFVRDHDRSLEFYIGQLGFTVVADARFEFGGRWVAVAPPDGSSILALIAPKRGSENYKLIGRPPRSPSSPRTSTTPSSAGAARASNLFTFRKRRSSEAPQPPSPTSMATPSNCSPRMK